jgi:hypothetical protein
MVVTVLPATQPELVFPMSALVFLFLTLPSLSAEGIDMVVMYATGLTYPELEVLSDVWRGKRSQRQGEHLEG